MLMPVFGPKENESLDIDTTRRLFVELTERVNKESAVKLTPEEVAAGFLRVANENMSKPIRALTEARGFRTSTHNLSCESSLVMQLTAGFGGAGGQHACAIARNLGIHSVLVHKYSSVLSAYGIALANIGTDITEPCSKKLEGSLSELQTRIDALRAKATAVLAKQGVESDRIEFTSFLNLRYEGTDTSLMIPEPEDGDFMRAFTERHRREFSFVSDKPLIVDGAYQAWASADI